jgi:hypothetical protein
MRALVGTGLCALALASLGSAFAMPQEVTSLRVTYWADTTKPATSVVWTLRCDPPSGSLPRPARACARLAAGGAKLFAPTPRGIACTQVYGGPQNARVVGTVRGTRVSATFTRTNGCQIARWKRISPWLVPAGGVP